MNSESTVALQHNLLPRAFKWLWMKYVTGVNDKFHCTNCLRGKYGKTLSKHNEQLATTSVVLLDEMPLELYAAIYICGVINRGYPRTNYVHNLHAVIRPSLGQCDEFLFENWHLKVKNGVFELIPSENDLPEQYRSLPLEFTTCRIFRWAVCSTLNINMSEIEE